MLTISVLATNHLTDALTHLADARNTLSEQYDQVSKEMLALMESGQPADELYQLLARVARVRCIITNSDMELRAFLPETPAAVVEIHKRVRRTKAEMVVEANSLADTEPMQHKRRGRRSNVEIAKSAASATAHPTPPTNKPELEITSMSGYEKYVLKVLCTAGGRAPWSDVQTGLRALMETDGVLLPADFLKAGVNPRARYIVQTANLRTKWVNANPPLLAVRADGLYALTQEGEAYAQDRYNLSVDKDASNRLARTPSNTPLAKRRGRQPAVRNIEKPSTLTLSAEVPADQFHSEIPAEPFAEERPEMFFDDTAHITQEVAYPDSTVQLIVNEMCLEPFFGDATSATEPVVQLVMNEEPVLV